MYIDIHNHGLYAVDDGAADQEESVEMLREARRQGAEAIIFTPHYRHGMFSYPKEKIEQHLSILKKQAERLEIKLYPGCEYHVDSHIIEAFLDGRCHRLADSDYVLTEYKEQTEYTYMIQYTDRLTARGYIPVIAHVERYQALRKKPQLCAELAERGALIQINADSVLGHEGYGTARFCRRLLKQQWVDVIASDAHGIGRRPNRMAECQNYVTRKYGAAYADRLFLQNPAQIIGAAHSESKE